MGTEAATSIGQGPADTGSKTSTSTSVAADMVSQNTNQGILDTQALAADVNARTTGDPAARETLVADVEARIASPVDAGHFRAVVQAVNDNPAAGGLPDRYNAQVEGQTFAVGDPNAPAISSWGEKAAGTGYREAWDATAARLGTQDPAAITQAIEAQLYPANATVGPEAQSGQSQPQPDQPAKSEEGIGAFFDGLVKGDFGDNDSWSATAGQVVGGFIPIVGQIGDARDTIAAIGGVIEGKEGAWGNLGLAAVAWVPGVGDLAKGAIRGGEKALDAGGEIAQQATRHADEAADVVRPRIEMDGGSKGDWSPELNARTLQPNADYLVNGYTYKTDGNGRVTDVSGQLELKTADRNSYQQGVSGREDRLPDDQGGHLIASIFNGPGERLNLVPMNGNFNMGAWRDLERTLQNALKENKSVEVKIEVKYAADTQRPESFRVTHIIDGVPETEMFKNVPGGK